MSTYLLTWNPKHWDWDMAPNFESLASDGFFDRQWSCGNTGRIELGDRVFLLRQGVEPKGIIAAGQATSDRYQDAHWDGEPDHMAWYIDVHFDSLLDPDNAPILELEQLQDGALGKVHWGTQRSGISIEPEAAAELEKLWAGLVDRGGQIAPVMAEEVESPELYFEGAVKQISVNAFERDRGARTACIRQWGTACTVCGFDFGRAYVRIPLQAEH